MVTDPMTLQPLEATRQRLQTSLPLRDHLNESVAARLESLLARVEGVRLARDLDRPVKFDARGEAHANHVAQQDRNPQ